MGRKRQTRDGATEATIELPSAAVTRANLEDGDLLLVEYDCLNDRQLTQVKAVFRDALRRLGIRAEVVVSTGVKSTVRVARLGAKDDTIPCAECGGRHGCSEPHRPTPAPEEFKECEDCAAKPGSPMLCDDCLRRRDAR